MAGTRPGLVNTSHPGRSSRRDPARGGLHSPSPDGWVGGWRGGAQAGKASGWGEEHWTRSPGLGCESSPMPCPWRRLLPLLLSPPGRWGWGSQGGSGHFPGKMCRPQTRGRGVCPGSQPSLGAGQGAHGQSPMGCSTGQGLGLLGGHHRGEGLGVPARPSFPAGARGSWLSPRPVPTTHLPSPYLRATRAGLSPTEPRNSEEENRSTGLPRWSSG